MAQGRLRRLFTRLLEWAWVPVVAFVLVVAVAMGCALWSPVPNGSTPFGHGPFGDGTVPRAVRQYDSEYTFGFETTGFGISRYEVSSKGTTFGADRASPLTIDVTVGRSGLPFRCMRWTDDHLDDPGDSSLWVRGIELKATDPAYEWAHPIPLMPEPVGMGLNVLIVSAAIVMPRLAWRGVVVFRRKRKGLCVKCAYPVSDFAVCPECGKPTGRDA